MKKTCIILSAAAIVLSQIFAYAEPVIQLYNAEIIDTADAYRPSDNVTFIVEVDGSPIAASAEFMKNKSFSSAEAAAAEDILLCAQDNVMSDIKSAVGSDIEKNYTYTALFNGFSIDAKYSDLDELMSIPGVKNVRVSEVYDPIKPMISTAEEQTGVTAVQNNLGYSGEGQVIAIIDSEFDVGHEFFASVPENPKYSKSDISSIINNTSLSANVTANQVYKNAKIPFAYDYGCGDDSVFDNRSALIHGSHVAGIAAGKNGKLSDGTLFSGVAPEAQLILMKITNASGGLPEAAILAALDDSAKFGVSAVNMSFGSDYASSKFASGYDSVLKNAKNAGILLSVSAGNASRGYKDKIPLTADIDYSASGTPAEFTYSTSVASSDNSVGYATLGELIFSDSGSVKYAPAHTGSNFYSKFYNNQYEYAYCGYGAAGDFSDASGKIALVRRGKLSFVDKAENAAAAGAAGIIIWNGENDYFTTVELSLPAAVVTSDDGQILFDRTQKTVRAGYPSTQSYLSPTAGLVSSYSSWGTSDSLELTPEITAPGGNIYSSVPDNKYSIMSGTSMAAPHLTGITALLNQYYETNPFSAAYNGLSGADKVLLFENLLMSTASVIKGNNLPASPRSQGAGLVNIEHAMTSPAILVGTENKAKISLKDNLSENITLEFTAKNLTDSPVTYNSLSLDVTTDGCSASDDGYVVDGTKRLTVVSENLPSSVTVPAGGEVKISADVRLSSNELANNLKLFPNGFYIDGFVYLSSDTSVDLSIPFSGFYGDWKSVPLFDTTLYDSSPSRLLRSDVPKSTGTYIAGKNTDNKYIMLGKNIYSDTSAPEYIAFSPNGDGNLDYPIPVIQPMRSCNVVFDIAKADSPDKTLYRININDGFNKFSSSTVSLSNLSSLDDGEYILTVNGCSIYGTQSATPDDSFSLPFAVDTQAPTVTEVSADKASGTLTVSAADNHYIQAITISYPDSNGETVTKTAAFANTKADGEFDTAAAEFDISGVSPKDVQISVSDYAANIASGVFDDFKYPLNIKSGTVSYSDTELTVVSYEIFNNRDENVSATPIAAFYDAIGRLICTEVKQAENYHSGSNEKTMRINKNIPKNAALKLFLWDSADSMKPVAAR